MDIAALAVNIKLVQVQQAASTAVLKMAMQGNGQKSQDLALLLESSGVNSGERAVNPHLGATIDIKG